MRTSKPFSTISYNSKEFLIFKLEQLILNRKISFYSFVHHFAEEDELKEHKHLLIIPNGQIDTNSIIEFLQEFDNNNIDKPLGCIPFRSSKFADWFLYCKHDIDYLASKGQTRKYHYSQSDFICSDCDYFNEEIHLIDMSKLSRVKDLRFAVENDISFEQLLLNGQIPIQQVFAYRHTYDTLKYYINSTFRNGRNNHELVNSKYAYSLEEVDQLEFPF